MLASCYGCADHRAFKDLKKTIDSIVFNAKEVEITCPLGTRFSGRISAANRSMQNDVSVLRFPMAVPQPVNASDFSGRVAISGFLSSTGNRVYSPATVKIDQTVFAEIDAGHINAFHGEKAVIASIQNHYHTVSSTFGIDTYAVHSWHAGIHPGCSYYKDPATSPDHWSNTVFANPRFLHFHTCGNYAPGEISWMVLDATIYIDGEKLWENGRICLSQFEQSSPCLDKWPLLNNIIAHPSTQTGL
jgi:hypothetical protein